MTNDIQLEKTPEFFYHRLKSGEEKFVRKTLGELKSYLDNKCLPDYLVAGVGGILRRKDPALATDIDFAVAGLKYSENHSFDEVIAYTKTVGNFFLSLGDQMKEVQSLNGGSGHYHGSGPFSRWNESVEAKIDDQTIVAESDLEKFGLYDSKGMQIRYGNLRPIDIQFVFNKSVDEWLHDQSYPPKTFNFASQMKSLNSPFFYSVLLRK